MLSVKLGLIFHLPQRRAWVHKNDVLRFPLKQITTKQTFLQVEIIQGKVTCYGYSTSIIGNSLRRPSRVMLPWGAAVDGDSDAETKPAGPLRQTNLRWRTKHARFKTQPISDVPTPIPNSQLKS